MLERDLWVDFNDADAKDRLSTLLEFATPGARIDVGEIILVADDEGNRAEAYVAGIYPNGVVELVLQGETFVSGEDADDADDALSDYGPADTMPSDAVASPWCAPDCSIISYQTSPRSQAPWYRSASSRRTARERSN